MRRLLLFFLIVLSANCTEGTKEEAAVLPEDGTWRGEIELQGQVMPFLFFVNWEDASPLIVIENGKERIRIEEAGIYGDSIYIPMHIFDTRIVAKFNSRSMKGYYMKNYLPDYRLPFSASAGIKNRFREIIKPPSTDITGQWDAYFMHSGDTSKTVGIFNQVHSRLTGTFLTTSGDYRYLDGIVSGDSLKLSTFDGEHAYLFKGKIIGHDSISGSYWSGKTWFERWNAHRNPDAALPDLDNMIHLKNGYDRIRFTLPDMNGKKVSLDDPTYRDKVVIVQILGTWCPNCMDETKFLADWYRRNNDRGIEIVALAFERKNDFDYARERIQRMIRKYDIGYKILFAGKNDKATVAQVLPVLDRSVSYPTTIFIDRKGKVRKIHMGFEGPGTSKYYERFIDNFNRFVNKMLTEAE